MFMQILYAIYARRLNPFSGYFLLVYLLKPIVFLEYSRQLQPAQPVENSNSFQTPLMRIDRIVCITKGDPKKNDPVSMCQ